MIATLAVAAGSPAAVLADDGGDTVGSIAGDILRSLWVTLTDNNIVPDEAPWPPTLWTFIGISVSFLLTRSVTRYIRHRSNSGEEPSGPVKDIVIGGVHIHHQVFGIVLMTVSGLWMLAAQLGSLGINVVAAVFGVGIGLTFDEFALWLHLHDVYWDPQGRVSIDAVAFVLVLTGEITVIASTVADLEEVGDSGLVAEYGWLIIAFEVLAILLTFFPAVICLLKGKPIGAGIGVMYIPVGVTCAIRVAKPHSWWARTMYRRPTSRRMRKARRRFDADYLQRWNRVRDFVGGAPTRQLSVADAPEAVAPVERNEVAPERPTVVELDLATRPPDPPDGATKR